jgi:hypothetical protein
MSIKLLIKGTPVEIPESGASPNWSPGIISAIEALTEAINSVSGTYDVAPQVQDISLESPNLNHDVNNLIFPKEDVRAAIIYYSVYRKTEDDGPILGEEIAEAGTLQIVYNEANPVANKWEIQREFVGNAKISFSVTDLGQIQFNKLPIDGINNEEKLSYRAISILNS